MLTKDEVDEIAGAGIEIEEVMKEYFYTDDKEAIEDYVASFAEKVLEIIHKTVDNE